MDPARPFPKLALVSAIRAFGMTHDMRRLASQVGAKKRGHRLQALSDPEVAALIADRAADEPVARKKVLKALARGLDAPSLAPRSPDEVTREVEALQSPDWPERARWIVALLSDSRPELWDLVPKVEPTLEQGSEVSRELREELGKTREGLRELVREHGRLAESKRALDDTARRRQEELSVLRNEVGRLREDLRVETERRVGAERERERAQEEAKAAHTEIARLRGELENLRRGLLDRDTGVTSREMRQAQEEATQISRRYRDLSRDYAALKTTFRTLKERLEESWGEGSLEEKDLKPRHPDEVLVVEAPLETDTRPAPDKVRLPNVPHHWPGGEERFARFLERVARSGYVKRVLPRRFQSQSHHGISFVTDEGDLVARVSEGDHAAQILIITTASHRGQGEFVRRELEPVFETNL